MELKRQVQSTAVLGPTYYDFPLLVMRFLIFTKVGPKVHSYLSLKREQSTWKVAYKHKPIDDFPTVYVPSRGIL